jgi:hypothetical protein
MSTAATNMESVFEDIDLTTLVLKSCSDDYVEEEQRTYNDHRGQSRLSPEMRKMLLRTLLRQTVHAISKSSRVCKLWRTASSSAFKVILEVVESRFQLMQAETLDFLRKEPVIFEGASLAPQVPREEAINVLPNQWSGQILLEPLRVCFELPVALGRGSSAGPLGNIRNPIAPYRQEFTHWSPTYLVRHARTAGHWLRVWTAELTWVDPPTHNPEALWLAVNRGCPVCGTKCKLQAQRVDLVNAEHANTDEFDNAMSMNRRSPETGTDAWVGLNAYLEIPWDLPDVHKRLVGKVPHDPVTRLATRILPYAHRAHMVTLKFKNTARQEGEHRTRSYKSYFDCPPGMDHNFYDQTEEEIMLGNVIGALYTGTPHPTNPKWDHGQFVKGLFKRRRVAIENSGLYKYMVDSGMEQHEIDKVCHPNQFLATLSLFPMRGHPAAHSWSSVLNLTEDQFQTLAWRGGGGFVGAPPAYGWGDGGAGLSGVDDELKRWRKQTLRHMVAFLSQRLPQYDHSAFFRVSELELLESNAGNVPLQHLQHLSDPYPTRILNAFEHVRFLGMPGGENVTAAVYSNRLLLETWDDFASLLADGMDNHLHIRNRQSRLDVSYDQMLKHFLRLDSVIGPSWRHVTRDAFDVEYESRCAQCMLLKLVLCYLKKVPDLAPAPLNIAHSRIIPGAPHHPNVWLRWFLKALVKPNMRQVDLDTGADWAYELEVDLRNTFIIDVNRPDKDRVDFENVGVHVTYYVFTKKIENERTTPMHMRMSVGIRLSELAAIRDGVRDTKAELDAGESLGSREIARGIKTAVPPMDLASWHHDACVMCQTLTRHVWRSKPLAIDLLRRFLDAEWTPMTQKHGMETDPKWVQGWQALDSHCLPGCEWFGSTASLLPFCKVRGLLKCACTMRCAGLA